VSAELMTSNADANDTISGPGVYMLRHKTSKCFQQVCRAQNVLEHCFHRLHTAFEATTFDPLGALLAITTAAEWDFYYESADCAGMR
jgi:hypothetical protein